MDFLYPADRARFSEWSQSTPVYARGGTDEPLSEDDDQFGAEGAEPAMKLGPHDAAKDKAQAAVRMAARYNNRLSFERREERGTFYEYNTQISLYPKSKMRRLMPPASTPVRSQRPVAVEPGQFQDGYVRLRTAEEVSAGGSHLTSL